jgi:CDP-diacylglycerol--serine O-phosphatidyltransferase
LFAAGCLIFAAMLFDALDGAAARWANQVTGFGAQLDSLCDAVSFGAAPAVLMLELVRPHGYHPRVVWVVAALYLVCALLRLARYHVTDDADPGVFRGLPTPGAAAVVASLPVLTFGPRLLSGVEPEISFAALWVPPAAPVVTLIVACLMVSRVRYPHAVRRLVRGRRGEPRVIRLIFAAAAIVVIPQFAVPLLAGCYAFAPPATAAWVRLRGSREQPTSHPPADGDGR